MKNRGFYVLFLILFFFTFTATIFPQQISSTEELVEKSIQAGGGNENIARIKNYSFMASGRAHYLSSGGKMKITSGRDPIITEVILADQNSVKRNCYIKVTEFEGLMKATYQSLAMLHSGLFTLMNFKDRLEFQGMKSFGPKKHYMATTQIGSLKVDFYLDSDTFTLKRIVFQGFDPRSGKYEVNHDFGPYQEVENIKIPSSWFSSQVGTRGNLYEIKDVKLNLQLIEEFFSKHDINVGQVKIAEGALNGNITEFSFQRNSLTIGTNWTNECIQKAGFQSKDKLIVQIKDEEIEIDFYDSLPPRSAYGVGAKLMMPNRRDENYIIYLLSPEFKQLSEKLEPLLPIQVKRK